MVDACRVENGIRLAMSKSRVNAHATSSLVHYLANTGLDPIALTYQSKPAMAMRSQSSLLPLLCISISISMLAAASANEEAALLAFKAAAIDGVGNGDPLASWNGSAAAAGGYCSWEGVKCWGRGGHRQVVELSLPYRGLTGFLSPAIGNLSSLRTINLNKSTMGFARTSPRAWATCNTSIILT